MCVENAHARLGTHGFTITEQEVDNNPIKPLICTGITYFYAQKLVNLKNL
jgi:hypothetical protein